MNNPDETDMAKLNEAGRVIAEDLFHAGFSRAQEYAKRFGIPEHEMPLVLANAYYRVAVLVNATAFRLDDEDLGKRIMAAIKAAARETPIPPTQ